MAEKIQHTEPTIGVNGSSISIHTSNVEEWYKALAVLYYEEIEEDDKLIDTTWCENRNKVDNTLLTDTEIKYVSRRENQEMKVTMRLYHRTGTFLVQGAAKYIELWHSKHYPVLAELVQKLCTAENSISCNNEIPVGRKEACEILPTSDDNPIGGRLEEDIVLKPLAQQSTRTDNVQNNDVVDVLMTMNTQYSDVNEEKSATPTAADTTDTPLPNETTTQPIAGTTTLPAMIEGNPTKQNSDEVTTNPLIIEAATPIVGKDDQTDQDVDSTPDIITTKPSDCPLAATDHLLTSATPTTVDNSPQQSDIDATIVDEGLVIQSLVANMDSIETKVSERRVVAVIEEQNNLLKEIPKDAHRPVISKHQDNADEDAEWSDSCGIENRKIRESTPRINKKRRRTVVKEGKSQIIDPRIEMLIENNRINIENMERVFLQRMEWADEKYHLLHDAFVKFQNSAEKSQSKYEKELHDSRTKYEKKIAEMKMSSAKDKELIQQQLLEITTLKNKVSQQSQLQQYQNKLSGELKDLETNIKNKIREEKDRREVSENETKTILNELQEQVRRKAAQSDLDKWKNSKTVQPPVKTMAEHGEQNWAVSSDSEEDEKHDDKGAAARYAYEEPKKKILIQENVVLLMDSNKTHIDVKQFWNKTKKLRVPLAADLDKTIDKFDFCNAEHIIIGTGTNDSDDRSADEIFEDLLNATKKIKAKYNTHVYISQIPPRLKYRKDVVKDLNLMIARNLPESVHSIMQEELTEQHLRDEKHIMEKKIGIYVKSMKNKIKEVLGIIPNNERKANSRGPRNHPGSRVQGFQHDVSHGSRVQGFQHDESHNEDNNSIAEQFRVAMEQSHKMMMNNMTQFLKNLKTG